MPRIRSQVPADPEYHRRKLRSFIDALKLDNELAGRNYELFFQQLLAIFTDNPPTSWRFLHSTYEYPILRVMNNFSGRDNDFLRVCGDGLLIVTSRFFDEKDRTLFPRRKDFYGQGDSAIIDFPRFSANRQKPYINAIRDLVTNSQKCHINVVVHGG